MADHIFPPHKRRMPELSRRGFLISACAAGAAFGFPRQGVASMDPGVASGLPAAAVGARYEPTIWYWIDSTSRVAVRPPGSGQSMRWPMRRPSRALPIGARIETRPASPVASRG